MAIGAMAAMAAAGLCVPDDVSIVGLDDIEVSAYQLPALTTIQQSFAELATAALHLLLDLLADHPPAATQIVMQPRLIVRNSTRRFASAQRGCILNLADLSNLERAAVAQQEWGLTTIIPLVEEPYVSSNVLTP